MGKVNIFGILLVHEKHSARVIILVILISKLNVLSVLSTFKHFSNWDLITKKNKLY